MSTVLFLSHGTSLADWNRQGILEAELAIHEGLSAAVAQDTSLAEIALPLGIQALLRPWWIPALLYAVVSPLVHWRVLRQSRAFQGHNGRALWAPTVARWIHGGHLTLRFGYLWSWDLIQRGQAGLRLRVALWSEWIACRAADRIVVAAPWQATYLREVHGIE